MMADLAKHFSAVWTLSARTGQPGGVYKDGHEWKTLLGSDCSTLKLLAVLGLILVSHSHMGILRLAKSLSSL